MDILLKQHSADLVFPSWTRWGLTDGDPNVGASWDGAPWVSCPVLGPWIDTSDRHMQGLWEFVFWVFGDLNFPLKTTFKVFWGDYLWPKFAILMTVPCHTP